MPKLTKQAVERLEKRFGAKAWTSELLGVPESGDYDIGQSNTFKLMDFQVRFVSIHISVPCPDECQMNGVNWLCRNWFKHQQCILADEMGLVREFSSFSCEKATLTLRQGKTVQIVTFLGLLHEKMKVFPSLIVVPNSTITNWVREFSRWAPHLRVVPFYGESTARTIIKRYELFHDNIESGTTGAKFHVLVTTYDTAIVQKELTTLFHKIPRWEVLVVDEGQRCEYIGPYFVSSIL